MICPLKITKTNYQLHQRILEELECDKENCAWYINKDMASNSNLAASCSITFAALCLDDISSYLEEIKGKLQ